MNQDDVFLEQVENLVSTARRALEEAESYASSISDPEMKKKAERILENL